MHLTYAVLAWGRSGRTNAAKIECAHRRACKLLTDFNQKILNFHSIYYYFALLKAFDANTLNFHQYFNDKLSSHQLSQVQNTRHTEQMVILILHYLVIQELNNVTVPSYSLMKQRTILAEKLHFQVYTHKTN